MFNADTLTASFASSTLKAANSFANAKERVTNTKESLSYRILAAIVARVMADEGATAKAASQWLGGFLKDHKAQASCNAYRSAVVATLTTDVIASLRGLVTAEAAVNPAKFAEVAEAGASQFATYWTDYKAARKAEKEAEERNAPRPDPIMTALHEVQERIAYLREQGENGASALSLILETLSPQVAPVQEREAA